MSRLLKLKASVWDDYWFALVFNYLCQNQGVFALSQIFYYQVSTHAHKGQTKNKLVLFTFTSWNTFSVKLKQISIKTSLSKLDHSSTSSLFSSAHYTVGFSNCSYKTSPSFNSSFFAKNCFLLLFSEVRMDHE